MYLSGYHGIGEVPRSDHGCHADGLSDKDHLAVGNWGWYNLWEGKKYLLGLDESNLSCAYISIDPPGFLGEPLKEGGAVPHLPLGFCQRLALFGGEDAGQLVGVLVAQVKPAAQQGRALLGSCLPPGAKSLHIPRNQVVNIFFKKKSSHLVSSVDGLVNVGLAHIRDVGDDLSGRGVGHLG